MRHAIRKNFCPACGYALFGDFQMGKISLIKEKILSQEFSKDLSSDLIFDISLFIVSEFTSSPASQEQRADSSEVHEEEVVTETEVDEESDHSELDEAPPVAGRSLAKSKAQPASSKVLEDIRRQVRSEIVPDDEDDLDDDMDLKVARLKRIAKENNLNKTGAMVRRVSD